MKKTLIIGGSRWLGPEIIASLLKKGHEVTVFNRGNNYGYELPASVKTIKGDRRENVNMEALGAEAYDYIYDMCCFNETDVDNLLKAIQPTAHIVFLSTNAVYKRPTLYPVRETHELGPWDSFGDYGTNKAVCEQRFRDFTKQHDLKLTIFRPVYLLGNQNYFDRENYYFSRIEKELPILMPEKGHALIQFAFQEETAWAFSEVPFMQTDQEEVLNVGGDEYITLVDFIGLCAEIVGKPANIIELDTDKFGLDEEHFYDDLYPFPNLNFVVSSDRLKDRYHMLYTPLETGLRSIYTDWKQHWDGNVNLYERESAILEQLHSNAA